MDTNLLGYSDLPGLQPSHLWLIAANPDGRVLLARPRWFPNQIIMLAPGRALSYGTSSICLTTRTPPDEHGLVDPSVSANRIAWETASRKHVREYDDLLAQAAAGSSLIDTERDLLRAVLDTSPEVVHLQSGHGLDDVALIQAGAKSVIGVDYSEVAAGAAQRRADELGALIWMPDLDAWAREVVRLLRPSGHLFIYEAHPVVPLWTWDADRPRIRTDRSYFARSHVNDTFPGNGALEWQWNLGQIVSSVVTAGLEILHLGEYAEPFWRAGGVTAAAWDGRLPNSFSLLARRR